MTQLIGSNMQKTKVDMRKCRAFGSVWCKLVFLCSFIYLGMLLHSLEQKNQWLTEDLYGANAQGLWSHFWQPFHFSSSQCCGFQDDIVTMVDASHQVPLLTVAQELFMRSGWLCLANFSTIFLGCGTYQLCLLISYLLILF